jgi:phosphatidylglycerol---prolipoprotein diacylglyceryl transferase
MITPFIPSTLTIGPFEFHLYGLFISIGIIIIYLAIDKKFGDKLKLIDYIFLALVTLFGARLLYLLHNTDLVVDDISAIWSVNDGGLAILGGIIALLFGIKLITKIRKLPYLLLLDTIFLWIPIAQAIGRWGNFVNQELYGLPCESETKLCLYIEPENRINGYEQYESFQPVFFYEFILNLISFGILYLLSRKSKTLGLPTGLISSVYLINYGFIRLITNRFRIDQGFLPFVSIESSDLISFILLVVGIAGVIWINRKSQTQQS